MARKYGGLTGAKVEPNQSSAVGSWQSPTEAYREQTVANWPVPAGAVNAPAGTIVLAPSSGVVNALIDTNNFLLCDGSSKSRSSYPNLYNIIGTKYGPGAGGTTFAVPNINDRFIYFKGVTASGAVATGSGVLGASHIHTFNRMRTTPGFNFGTGGPGGKHNDGAVANTVPSSVEGTDVQNELRKRETIPLVAANSSVLPVGSIIPILWPNYDGANFPVTNYLICSGQAVSRTTYSTLYTRLGNQYGSGDGSTTFNIPDYRGLFLSGTRQVNQTQVSGVINGSGFLPDTFVQHRHLFSGGQFGERGGNGSPSSYAYPNLAGSPASTASTGPSAESRTANISVIWALVAA